MLGVESDLLVQWQEARQDLLRQIEKPAETPRIVRCVQGLPDETHLPALPKCCGAPLFYWKSRSGDFEVVALGKACSFTAQTAEEVPKHLAKIEQLLVAQNSGARFYGGMRFDGMRKPEAPWSSWPVFEMVLPRFEWVRMDSCYYFACNAVLESSCTSQDMIDQLDEEWSLVGEMWEEDSAKSLPSVIKRKDTPEPLLWHIQMEIMDSLIKNHKIEKVVLARETRLDLDRPCDPPRLFSRLQDEQPHGYHFLAFDPERGAFMGASPECLYKRQGRQISTEALAGTAQTGGLNLLASEKESREHGVVAKVVGETLKECCENYHETTKTHLIEHGNLRHLRCCYEGLLQEHINDHWLLANLHPTPAVGTFPRHHATTLIPVFEAFDRGWYSGPIGWLGKDAAEFAVAIRSCLLVEDQAYLYGGAGVVAASESEKEWEEIERKIAPFLRVFDNGTS